MYVCMYPPSSQHERRAAILGSMFDLRAMLQQERHDAMVALPAGRGEGDVIVGATGGVDCCSCFKQELCYLWRYEGERERRRGGEKERGREGERERRREGEKERGGV